VQSVRKVFVRRVAAYAALGSLVVATAAAANSATTPGIFSTAQAATGSKVFAANCASCHGANLEGGAGPALSGQKLNALAKNTNLSVSRMYTFFSQEMPLNKPGSLTSAQYLAIMAYILKFNGYPAGSSALTTTSVKNATMIVTSLKS
jgi:mono/diheme cytochrome c family protein